MQFSRSDWARSSYAKTKVLAKALSKNLGLSKMLRPNLTDCRSLEFSKMLIPKLDLCDITCKYCIDCILYQADFSVLNSLLLRVNHIQ